MTTLYWNFLDRHETELAASPRTASWCATCTRLAPAEREALRVQAADTLANLDGL
jgi:deoxyribodipyrimidine photolyase-related protein